MIKTKVEGAGKSTSSVYCFSFHMYFSVTVISLITRKVPYIPLAQSVRAQRYLVLTRSLNAHVQISFSVNVTVSLHEKKID
jgi:hypothetical protein